MKKLVPMPTGASGRGAGCAAWDSKVSAQGRPQPQSVVSTFAGSTQARDVVGEAVRQKIEKEAQGANDVRPGLGSGSDLMEGRHREVLLNATLMVEEKEAPRRTMPAVAVVPDADAEDAPGRSRGLVKPCLVVSEPSPTIVEERSRRTDAFRAVAERWMTCWKGGPRHASEGGCVRSSKQVTPFGIVEREMEA